jgi:flagellar basal-body rod protein FlgC
MAAAASGMRVQTARMRFAAENMANANSTGQTPGSDPYRRRIPLLQGTDLPGEDAFGVRLAGAIDDQTQFRLQYNPSHPAADASGMVKMPNVDSLIEMMDLREASRAYEANLSMIEAARSMTSRALDVLRR